MDQKKRREYLIEKLLEKNPGFTLDQRFDQITQLRTLMNLCNHEDMDNEFMEIQDAYLQEELMNKQVITISMLEDQGDNLYIIRGDLTAIQCDAIVNSSICIENCIHIQAGIQLCKDCKILHKELEVGQVRSSSSYNLLCSHVFHVKGPSLLGEVTEEHQEQLKNCYENSLKLADEQGLDSIVFPCLSTGSLGFPDDLACQIAIDTVKKYKKNTNSNIKVIFHVTKDMEEILYKAYLK